MHTPVSLTEPATGQHLPAADSDPATAPSAFYNTLASSYDRMVGFEKRVHGAGRLIAALLERFDPVRAAGLDLGCGTGAFACALAVAGFPAAGLDLAEEMLVQARANAARLGLDVRFVTGCLEALPQPFAPHSAGLVLCLGNTLPHLLAPEDLGRAFSGIAALLAPGGLAVIQTLNYDRILERQERIVSVDRDGDATFLRFYDFLADGLLRFNLLRVTWEGAAARPAPLISVLLRPYRRQDLAAAAQMAGLDVVLSGGGADLTPYAATTSDTLLLALQPTLTCR
jgi:SAM-dependent methyltransferase